MAISFFIFIGKYDEILTDGVKYTYSWSFGLGWTAVVIYIISAAAYGARAFIILKDIQIGKEFMIHNFSMKI